MPDLDNLLDITLDDLEDLPSFEPFPAGAHQVLASFATKDINGKAAVELSLKLVETVELDDSTAKPPKAGDVSSTMFMLDNEYGRGNLKKCAAPFGEALQFSTIREIVEGVKEVECVVLTSVRVDKNDPDKKYLQVKEINVL
jgi:hypothetical protein